jgi:hypothetical protein
MQRSTHTLASGPAAPAARAAVGARIAPRRAACRASAAEAAEPAGRREALGLLLAAGAALALPRPAAADEPEPAAAAPAPAAPAPAAGAARFERFSDATLAYAFDYPVATAAGRALPLALSRRPERYSSAAPLTADARQRVVAELVSLAEGVTVSVCVGPPPPALRAIEEDAWTARAVAEAVLADRSTARVTSGQRVSLAAVEAAAAVVRPAPDATVGPRAFFYDAVSQGSPTARTSARETYRHAVAATAVRRGAGGGPFLVTLTLACPDELWGELEGPFRAAAASFELAAPGEGYVAPDTDPWRFF